MDSNEEPRVDDDGHAPAFLYPTTTKRELTPEQSRLLDQTFFGSSATAYWRSRIDLLLREPTPIDYAVGLAADLRQFGLDPDALATTQPSARERETQRALDAFALRHHLAESLVRLVRAVLEVGEDRDKSLWATMAEDRSYGADLVGPLLRAQEEGVPAGLFLTPGLVEHLRVGGSPDVGPALQMHWHWVRRAVDLLVSVGLDSNVGNNKLKHGLAVRARDDRRVDYTTTPPNEDGTVDLSALQAAVPLVAAVSLEFLERVPSKLPHGGSWEVTVLNLRPAELLAECLQLCIVWASVFTAAAAWRIGDEGPSEPERVLLTSGPSSEPMRRESVGMRQGLTSARDGTPPRPLTMEVRDELITFVTAGPGQRVRVVSGRQGQGSFEVEGANDD